MISVHTHENIEIYQHNSGGGAWVGILYSVKFLALNAAMSSLVSEACNDDDGPLVVRLLELVT